MSTDIQPGKIPPLVGNSSTSKPLQQDRNAGPATSGNAAQSGSADTVSMTDQASRLKKFEALLAEIPHVNSHLVAEMKQAIADGSLDMDYEGTAAKLIQMESAKTDSSNG